MKYQYPKKILKSIMDDKVDPFLGIKKKDFSKVIIDLTNFHKRHCDFYNKILFFEKFNNNIESIPPLPARLFKSQKLISIPKKEIFKTMFSSGTSGSQSKIYIDKESSLRQIKVLKSFHFMK